MRVRGAGTKGYKKGRKGRIWAEAETREEAMARQCDAGDDVGSGDGDGGGGQRRHSVSRCHYPCSSLNSAPAHLTTGPLIQPLIRLCNY